jgi:hypothetical protein
MMLVKKTTLFYYFRYLKIFVHVIINEAFLRFGNNKTKRGNVNGILSELVYLRELLKWLCLTEF